MRSPVLFRRRRRLLRKVFLPVAVVSILLSFAIGWIGEATTNGTFGMMHAGSGAPPAEAAQEVALPIGSAFPIELPARVTSEFGPRSSNISTTYGRASSYHKGIDFACYIGQPLYAVRDGTVVHGEDPGGWGYYAILKADDGDEFLYGHVHAYIAENGQHVNAGAPVAQCGKSGNVTAEHLHFEYWPGGGNAIDPRPLLEELGLPKKGA